MSTGETPPASRTTTRLVASELVGVVLADRFRPLRVVSDGANTTIFDAVDEQSGRTVTLKLVRPGLAASPSFRAEFDDVMRRTAALSHPNIAAVFDWGMTRVLDTSTAYVVIEQLTGGSLRDLFDRGRRLSPSQALAVGLDACRGLDHAHRRGFVHGELTPSKLVFGDDRRLRIVDFGLARLLGGPTWAQPESVPTHVAWYAAPEQGLSRPIDGKADVYALCLSLHEAVTGALPFKSDSTVATLAARVGKLMPVSADLGPLASVFERAGRPDPADRSTAAELGKGLVQAASKLPRPEPLPLLSTGLFETPIDQLRSPDDPTGGVVRPSASAPDLVVVPIDEPRPPAATGDPTEPPTVPSTVPAGGDTGDDVDVGDQTAAQDDLVITPLDSDVQPDAPSDPSSEVDEPPSGAAAVETRVMAPVAPPAAPESRRRGSLVAKLGIALVVLLALGALGVIAMQLFRTPVYVVPDLVGMPQAEARNVVAPNDWVITVEEERSDVVPVVGQVVRTVPQAGVELAEGEPFLIVVSGGPTLRELPESTGLPLAEAQTRLVERGLEPSVVQVFDEDVPADVVISWSVPGDPTLTAGALVEPMTPVELVVSMGPEPRIVPSLVGRTADEVRAELEGLRLVYVEEGREFSDEIPLGSVIRQNPEPGVEVARDTPVGAVVSLGPDLVTFPDLSAAATFEQAAALLTDAGFVPQLVFGDAQGAVRSYTIDGRQPGPGETFRRGTTVQLEAL